MNFSKLLTQHNLEEKHIKVICVVKTIFSTENQNVTTHAKKKQNTWDLEQKKVPSTTCLVSSWCGKGFEVSSKLKSYLTTDESGEKKEL